MEVTLSATAPLTFLLQLLLGELLGLFGWLVGGGGEAGPTISASYKGRNK